MASRPSGNGSISFGLVSIPVKLFTAASSKSVSFNLLHAKDLSRIQQKIFCPKDDAIVERSELVRGYEVEKGRYVTFTDEELKALESPGGDHTIEITEFAPMAAIDPVYFETAYHLGCEPSSAKAYRLLAAAMEESGRVAIGRHTMRGKEHLIVIRPCGKGLMMHTLYYTDEMRAADEVDYGGGQAVKEAELALARRLIDELTVKKLDLAKYRDGYRERVLEAAQKKIEGREVTEAPTEPHRGQVIDLMAALKASLDKRAHAASSEGESAEEGNVKAKATARGPRAAAGGSRRAGSRK